MGILGPDNVAYVHSSVWFLFQPLYITDDVVLKQI